MQPPETIGSYRVQRLLGVGSFATVWLGHDAQLDGHVAIKVLAENWSHDLRVRERFRDECRLLWRLDHPRLVRVHSVGELSDGRPYAVLAWADAGSLRDRLAGGPLPVPWCLWLLREIAAGVAVLHDHEVVHRDLTPGNVLLRTGPGGEEQVLIADLGLAKALAAASGLTARAGTPGYMAPEQDDPLALVDARADVYGLGRLGAHLLAEPAAGPTPALPPPAPYRLRPGVPTAVAAVLATACAARPDKRYRDAAAFLSALDTALAIPPAPGPLPRRRRRRRAGVLAAVVAATVLAGVAAAGAVGDWWRPGAGDTARDGTGRLSVALPEGWRAAGSGWSGRPGGDGGLEPALLVSPDPDRWASDPAVPGAFIGVTSSLAEQSTPAGFLAERTHPGCQAAPVRTTGAAGVDWTVAAFTRCATGKPQIVEAAGLTAAGTALLYVQLAPPAGSGPQFVDTLLAGVRVRD